MRTTLVCLFLISVGSVFAQPPVLHAIVIENAPAEARTAVSSGIAARLTAAGYDAHVVGMDFIADAAKFAAARPDLLVLTDASRLPVTSVGPIQDYLKSGGDLIALNTPMWRSYLLRDGDSWIDRDEFLGKHTKDLLLRPLFDIAAEVDQWKRNTNDGNLNAVYESVADSGVPGGNALHCRLERVSGWETLAGPMVSQPFPSGDDLTVIMAKGTESAPQLEIEWREKDQSRWIATITLTTEWRPYVLTPDDFKFWESNPARKGDKFHPENAVQLCIGLAHTHTRLGREPHEYWVGPIATASRTPLHDAVLASAQIPALDTLCPGYKFFDCSSVASITGCADSLIRAEATFSVPKSTLGIQPRPGAGGFNKERAWRWQPLLEAHTASGEWRGNPAALLVHADGPFKGGVWASFAVQDPAWYATEPALALIESVAKTMHRGVFLVDGGTNFFTYFEDQTPVVGARVVNVNATPATDLTVRGRIVSSNSGAELFQTGTKVSVDAMQSSEAHQSADGINWPGEGARVIVELADAQGNVIDRAAHDINFWRTPKYPSFVTVKDGDFQHNGKRWRSHGVNYMPSSGIGTEDGGYFEYWIDKQSYDPDIVQRDLEHMKDMGLNAVSIFIYRQSMESQNLLDFLRRLDVMGMKANLSLRPGTPLEFQWDAMRDLIEYYRLAQNDTVFAYDLAWEPMFGNQVERKPYDAAWRAWIDERYGSIENAEKDWQFAAPRDESGAVTGPAGELFEKDGPHRIMIAAYRRFLDTLLYEKYSEARRMVRGIDPNHLISFRMTEAGDPTFRGTRAIPYSWQYLPGAVDILEPEAYGRIGDWEKVKPGIFESEYARWAHPGLPMMWAEAGVSAWDMSAMKSTEKNLVYQGEYFSNLYRMLLESGSDGVFFWWYPGGYRANERSDFGIINADGSDRPATAVIRKLAKTFEIAPNPPAPSKLLTADFDAAPDSIATAYDSVRDQFWKAYDNGERAGLKTDGTGTTSANCPRIAVGNTPLNDFNPPKYLDAFFDSVEIQNSKGEWQRVRSGDAVTVTPGNVINLRVAYTNLGEATWLARSDMNDEGGVWIFARAGANDIMKSVSRDVRRFESVSDRVLTILVDQGAFPNEIEFHFEAQKVAAFGPRFRVLLNVPLP